MLTEVICGAIKSRTMVIFGYKDSVRTVEPHLLGQNKKGHLILSAWQIAGGSGQSWRAFEISRMQNVAVLDDAFEQPRPGYNSNDSTMVRILCRL